MFPGLFVEPFLYIGDGVQGTRTRDGRLGPSRKGVGRLVAACRQPPLGALPASHSVG